MHRAGVLALFQLRAGKPIRYLEKNLPGIQQMCLNYAAAGKCEQLKADLLQRITEAALYPDETVPRDRASLMPPPHAPNRHSSTSATKSAKPSPTRSPNTTPSRNASKVRSHPPGSPPSTISATNSII